VSELPEDFDCQTCGACCCSPLDHTPEEAPEPFVAVNAEDDRRIHPKLGRRLVVLDPRAASWSALAVRRADDGRVMCVALEGDPGRVPRVRCMIYEIRPTACRDVMPGDMYCLESRRRMGL
jgi:uncharacterized protein